MFVSLAQLFGFAKVLPIQSRAGVNQQQDSVIEDKQGITHVREKLPSAKMGDSRHRSQPGAMDDTARRQEVKAQSTKPTAKAKTPAAASKAKAAKSMANPAVAKPAVKTAAKPQGKPAAPVKSTKPKPAVKAVKVAVPASKSKATAKPAAAVNAPVAKKAESVTQSTAAKSVSKSGTIKVGSTVTIAQPPKTGRGKSSLMNVPPPAPVLASTAAKASYLHTMSSTALVPPPQVSAHKDPKLANNWKTKSAEQLVDAEVLAMSDAEYMNDKQMAFFRVKLVRLKQEILNSAGETTEHLREDTVIVPDPADRATIEEEHALELRTRDRERKLLKKIEQSIGRIDAGDYGYCDETGEPIGVGRLLARPTATLSLEAQQRRELKQKMFGD